MTLTARQWFREPAIINAVQCVSYALAGIAGLMAAFGGLPTIITLQIGPLLSVAVGSILFIGCSLGAFAVTVGHWWLERIALLVLDLGWVCLMVPTLFYAFTRAQSPQIWLIVALEIMAIADNIKRYRRIDWAYLDPTK